MQQQQQQQQQLPQQQQQQLPQQQQQQQMLLDLPLPPPLHHPSFIQLPSPSSHYSYSPDLFSPPQYTPTCTPPDLLSPPAQFSTPPHPDYFSPQPGPSWATRPPPPPRNPPPSPTRHHLVSPSVVLEDKKDKLVPGSVGRVAIQLARQCVFGPDVMATGILSTEGMNFIKKTLR